MSSKQELSIAFNKANLSRQYSLVNQTRVFQELLLFMDYKIRKELNSFTLLSICGGERSKFMVDMYFDASFTAMNLQEKVQLYANTIKSALLYKNLEEKGVSVSGVFDEEEKKLVLEEEVKFKLQYQKGFRSWTMICLTLNGYKIISDSDIKIDLRNYLLRKSKKTQKQCYVLEAVRKSQPQTIRFAFLSEQDQKQFLSIIASRVDNGWKDSIRRMVVSESGTLKDRDLQKLKSFKNVSIRENINTRANVERENQNPIQELSQNQHLSESMIVPSNPMIHSSVLQEIIKKADDQNLSQDLQELVQKQNEKQREHRQKEYALIQGMIINLTKDTSPNQKQTTKTSFRC